MVVSNTEITATTPAQALAGSADVIIVTPGGSVTGSGAFTYTAPTPTFTSISPTSGTTAGGTSVTITGTGFTGATAVTFSGAAATSFTVISNTEITATTPAGTAGAVNVIITAPGGTLTETGAFTYTATTSIPTVTEISPTYGPVSVNTPITITGTGFTGATAVTVGGTAVTSFTVVSATEITATTPATSTAGQVDVLITTPSGPSSSVAGDKYTFAATATTIPVPLFIASPTSGTAPLEVTFTDESTGSPASWSWAFGDGNASTLQDPTNTYVNNGTYTVTLTETNLIGQNATTMTGYIVVGATTPVAAFTAAPTSGTAPLTVQFTDQSTGSPTTWEWSFGDGSAGSAQSPSHTYQTAGTYTVTLTATNSEGSSTNSATQTITVDSAEPATTVPTPVITTAPTFAVGAEATTSSVDNWLAQQNAEIPSVAPTKKSPGYDALAALIGCGAVAGIALRRRH
jgi:PKD repeat protein